MTAVSNPLRDRVRVLVDEVRPTCLWYLREDYYPETREEVLRVLEAIEQHGDVSLFRRTAEIRQWLSRPSSAPSADS